MGNREILQRGSERVQSKHGSSVVRRDGSDGKESTCHEGGLGSIPELGRFPREGNGYSFQYSGLENPHGQRSLVGYHSWGCRLGHDWATYTSLWLGFRLQLNLPLTFCWMHSAWVSLSSSENEDYNRMYFIVVFRVLNELICTKHLEQYLPHGKYWIRQ